MLGGVHFSHQFHERTKRTLEGGGGGGESKADVRFSNFKNDANIISEKTSLSQQLNTNLVSVSNTILFSQILETA